MSRPPRAGGAGPGAADRAARTHSGTPPRAPAGNIDSLDAATQALVRLAAVIAGGDEPALREAMARAAGATPPAWVDELLVQSYLFCGFPRTLNAAREWRRISGVAAPVADQDAASGDVDAWRRRGEATCAAVYGASYEALRRNVRALHPALDEWMIVEGYGKILARPGLDLARRELCIVAVCAATRQDRQLHSHLLGALNAGAGTAAVGATLELVQDLAGADAARAQALLWRRVQGP